MYSLQAKLYKLRKEKGYTQAQMGEFLNISEASYRSKELDQSDFKLSEVFKIARLFEEDIGSIFTERTSRNVG